MKSRLHNRLFAVNDLQLPQSLKNHLSPPSAGSDLMTHQVEALRVSQGRTIMIQAEVVTDVLVDQKANGSQGVDPVEGASTESWITSVCNGTS